MSTRRIPFAAALVVGAAATFAPQIEAQSCTPVRTATYELTFDSVWSSTLHPQDFPFGAHYSGLVGGTHNSNVVFWEPGGLATNGIERMAETGSKTALINEVNAAINAGDALEVVSGPAMGTTPGSVKVTLTVSSDYPLATVVSMIAPSPDWFVGTHGVNLMQGNQFVDQLVVSLDPYDSGTDSGTTYTSPNNDTNPQEPIFRITGYPFFNVPLGTFTFDKISEDCLGMCVQNLTAGQTADICVNGGTPGETVAVLWSTSLGSYQANAKGWCVDFGLQIPASDPRSRVVALGTFNGAGEFNATQFVPAAFQGRDVKFQAAQMNTCPDSCMSNIVEETVQ